MNQCVDFARRFCSDRLCNLAEPLCVVHIMRTFRRFFDQRGAFKSFASQRRNAGFELRRKFVLPARERVNPSFHSVFVDGVFIKGTRSTPAIVNDQFHRRLVPTGFAYHSPLQCRRHNIVAFLKNISLHDQIFAGDAFDRIPATVNERLQIFNDRARKRPKHSRSIKRIRAKGKREGRRKATKQRLSSFVSCRMESKPL